MPRDKTASHVKIMAAAREEFMEQGFERASMWSIGERCGLTAAGIYRHCRDKADLFDQLVSPAVGRLERWLDDHASRYAEAVRGEGRVEWRDSEIDMMKEMLKAAPIVILDEATAYTDPENEAVIQRSVSRLTRGKTLIVIAHRLSTVTDADKIYVVKDGRIDDCGTHEELLARHGLYEAMWTAHMEVKDHA